MQPVNSYKNWLTKYPFLFWSISVISGILLQTRFHFSIWILLSVVIPTFIVIGAFSSKKLSTWKFYYAESRALLSIMSMFLLGLLLPNLQSSSKNPFPEWVLLDGDKLELIGQIHYKGKSNSGNNRYVMEVDTVGLSSVKSATPNLNVLLSSKRNLPDLETIHALVDWQKVKKASTPGMFNYADYLSKDNIWYTAKLDSIIAVYPTDLTGVEAAQKWMKSGIRQVFEPQHQGLAEALLLGDKSLLSSQEKQRFAQSGLSHIFAVSGLHVGFVVAPFFYLLLSFRNSVRKMMILTVVFSSALLAYVMLTGSSPSVVRAAIMAFLLFIARARFLPSNGLNILGATAFIILCYNSQQLFDIGFQLSFAAVGVIMVVGPSLNKWLISAVPWSPLRWIILTITMSFLIQLALSPLLALYFETLSFAGSFSNLLAMIPAGLLVQIGLPSIIVLPLIPSIQPVLSFVLNPLVFVIQWAAEMGESLEFLQIQSPSLSFAFLWYWLVFLFGLTTFKYSAIRKIVALTLVISLLVYVGFEIKEHSQSQKLEVTMLDVGQGDALFIQTPSMKHYLIDTGPGFGAFSEAKNVIIPFLKHRNIAHLDGIFISHWHADHSGGLKYLLESIQVESVYGPPSERALKSDKFRALTEEQVFFLDAQTPLAILNPSSFDHPHDENDNSLVMLLNYGSHKMLFMGDAEKSVEEELLRDYSEILDVDVLKVGHHGSRTSSTKAFVDIVKPEIALVSNAWKSRFRHPNPEAIDVIDNYAKLYFTALHGTVSVLTDGQEIEVLLLSNKLEP